MPRPPVRLILASASLGRRELLKLHGYKFEVQPANIDDWTQFILKQTDDRVELITRAPPSGIWRMATNKSITHVRRDTDWHTVADEQEAFYLRIAGPGPLVRGDDDLLRLADLGADERGVEALEEPALSDDDRRLDVDLLLVELAFFLRDLVMGRVEKSLGPVRVDRPGIVLEPSNVALFDRLGDQPLTASTF